LIFHKKKGLPAAGVPSTEPPRETIKGEERLDLLQRVMRTRGRVRMEIPASRYCWITMLLALAGDSRNRHLVIDPVADFLRALQRSGASEIQLSFFDREGVPCSFSARVLAVQPREIWAEFPPVIYRWQRRAYYRVQAGAGMEIIFQDAAGPEIKAQIKDYGLGGLAFYKDRGTGWFRRLVEAMELRGNRILIPSGTKLLEIPVALAVVRRITVFHPEAIRGALEFLRIPEASRSQLTRLVFEQQRQRIQKTKEQEGPPGLRGFPVL
jgi:c-di-GMP-binding flagellar brake protein YcgR